MKSSQTPFSAVQLSSSSPSASHSPIQHSKAQGFVALLSGLLFALGLGVGGMLNPANVQGFLNIFGEWKPALAGVMGGAIFVTFFANLLAKRQATPKFAPNWSHLPSIGPDLSGKAKLGAVLFGMGWGLSGLCPGPAIVSLASLNSNIFVFVIAMFVGFLLHDRVLHNWLNHHTSK